jgi:hypothetical protein
MILDLDRTTLEMVRGDTFILSLPLNEGTREHFVRHVLTNDEQMYIGIMKPNQSFEDAYIRCVLTSTSEKDSLGNCILRLHPEHTANMIPGKYYFTVKFVSKDYVQTLVDSKLFFVTGSNPCACEG